MLACDAKYRRASQDQAMQNARDLDSRCGLACDANAGDAKSLVMWVERCQPLWSRLPGGAAGPSQPYLPLRPDRFRTSPQEPDGG